jgi:hypothetical protein
MSRTLILSSATFTPNGGDPIPVEGVIDVRAGTDRRPVLERIDVSWFRPVQRTRQRQTYVPPRPHRRKPKGLVGGPVPSTRGMRPKLTPATLRQIHRRVRP